MRGDVCTFPRQQNVCNSCSKLLESQCLMMLPLVAHCRGWCMEPIYLWNCSDSISTMTNNLKVTWQLTAVITKCETINHLHGKSHFTIVKIIYMYIYWFFLTRAKCCATDVGHQHVCCKSSWMWLMLERFWLMFGWEHMWVQISCQDGVTSAWEMICKKQVLF
jgi:hypothetical protein